jgi:hypothetical protein
MSNIRIPPHLQVAQSVTEEEYMKAKTQGRIVMICAMTAGVVSAIPLVWLYGFLLGLPAAGIAGALAERVLSAVFKDAHKVRTQRIQKYRELKEFKERHGLP